MRLQVIVTIMDNIDTLIAKRFRNLVERAKDLNRWQQRLDAVLDPSLRPHVKVANIDRNCLVLQVNSASWATRVRYAIPQILTGLKPPDATSIREIRCIVRPDHDKLRPQHRHIQRHLSNEACDLINATANGIKDPELRLAMQKLSGK